MEPTDDKKSLTIPEEEKKHEKEIPRFPWKHKKSQFYEPKQSKIMKKFLSKERYLKNVKHHEKQ